MMRLVLSVLIFFSGLQAQAIVSNVQPLSPLELSPNSGGSYAVVAGPAGWFLVDGRRIDPDGRLVDMNRVEGTSGRAVAWENGWLSFEQRVDGILTRRLLTTGASSVVGSFPSFGGSLTDVESGHGQIVLVEERYETGQAGTTWVTHRTLDGVTHIQRYENLTGTRVARTASGFRFAGRSTTSDRHILVWNTTTTGVPLGSFIYQTQQRTRSDGIDIVANGNTTLLVLEGISSTELGVISSGLERMGTILMPQPDRTDVATTIPLPVDSGFFVPYYVRPYPGDAEWRAKLISLTGSEIEDVAADPIMGADSFEGRYFVLRPWRDGAIAIGDPRAVATDPVRVPAGTYGSFSLTETVVSEGVTLAIFWHNRYRFRRLDEAGNPIDAEPIEIPNADVTPIPGGFAFLWREGDRFLLRRLHARGDWMDPEAIELLSAHAVISADVGGGGEEVLVAWTSARSIHWQTFSVTGTPLSARREVAFPHYPEEDFGAWPLIDVYSSGSDHLLVVNHHFECRITCSYPRVPVHTLVVNSSGVPRGPVTTIEPDARASTATALTDGSWLLAVTHHGFVRLSRDGDLIRTDGFPEGIISFVDVKAAGTGWTAADDQGRVYDFESSAEPRVLGWVALEPDHRTMLGANDVIVFSRPAEELRAFGLPPTRVYSGILEAAPGDVSITLVRAWRHENRTRAEVEIRNKSNRSTAVSLQIVPTMYEWDRAPNVLLPANGVRRVVIAPSGYRVFGVEARTELEDPRPLDNMIRVSEEDIAEPWKRGTRR